MKDPDQAGVDGKYVVRHVSGLDTRDLSQDIPDAGVVLEAS